MPGPSEAGRRAASRAAGGGSLVSFSAGAVSTLLRPSGRLAAAFAIAVVFAASTACELIYGISGNEGPLDASDGPWLPDTRHEGMPAEGGTDGDAKAPSGWCSKTTGWTFCDDFDEDSSLASRGWVVSTGSGTVDAGPADGAPSPPNELTASVTSTSGGYAFATSPSFPFSSGQVVQVDVSADLVSEATDGALGNPVPHLIEVIFSGTPTGGAPQFVIIFDVRGRITFLGCVNVADGFEDYSQTGLNPLPSGNVGVHITVEWGNVASLLVDNGGGGTTLGPLDAQAWSFTPQSVAVRIGINALTSSAMPMIARYDDVVVTVH